MVLLISGASHAGKTMLAQKLMVQLQYPYFSIDHLKMGLVRSEYTNLTPQHSDQVLTEYLWPILREMIKTVIENGQNLIIEGCYIPATWEEDFAPDYLKNIRHISLVMSQQYIHSYYPEIFTHANDIEQRLDDSECTIDLLLQDNAAVVQACIEHSIPYILIDQDYSTDLEKGLRACLQDLLPIN